MNSAAKQKENEMQTISPSLPRENWYEIGFNAGASFAEFGGDLRQIPELLEDEDTCGDYATGFTDGYEQVQL